MIKESFIHNPKYKDTSIDKIDEIASNIINKRNNEKIKNKAESITEQKEQHKMKLMSKKPTIRKAFQDIPYNTKETPNTIKSKLDNFEQSVEDKKK